jgi:hypothetical protein
MGLQVANGHTFCTKKKKKHSRDATGKHMQGFLSASGRFVKIMA